MIESIEVLNLPRAIRAMRNPLDSWEKSDSYYLGSSYIIGENDAKLSQKLSKAGGEHSKHLRYVIVNLEIIAPRYFWQEFDTYKFQFPDIPDDPETLSCSTMHTIHSRDLTQDDFIVPIFQCTLDNLNILIRELRKAKEEKRTNAALMLLEKVKRNLPEGFLQRRSVQMSMATLLHIVKQRENHKLAIWREFFCRDIKKSPYFREMTGVK